jgi:thiamine kinase-like enzyme
MDDAGIPAGIDGLTPDWLTAALRAGGAVRSAKVIGCAKEVIGQGVGLMAQLVRCGLEYDHPEPGAPASLIAKMPTQVEGNRAIADLFNFYRSETGFYREIAPGTRVKTPTLYYANFEPQTTNFVILMEEVSAGTPGDQVNGCDQRQAEAAVRALAKLHAAWWGHPRLEALGWLPWNNDAIRAQAAQGAYMQAWGPFVQYFGAQVPREILDLGERFAPRVIDVLDKLAGHPWTLLHGDFRLDNLFFAGGSEPSVTVIDWQIVSRGRGAFDLAYFVTGSVSPADRRAWEPDLLHLYHALLAEGGVEGYSFAQLTEDYRRSVLFTLLYAVIILGRLDMANERGMAVFQATLERTVSAILDQKAGELLD